MFEARGIKSSPFTDEGKFKASGEADVNLGWKTHKGILT